MTCIQVAEEKTHRYINVLNLQVPLLPEDIIGAYDTLNLTTRGILRVRCISASGLRKADIIGKGDPFVVLETVPMQPAKTRVIYTKE